MTTTPTPGPVAAPPTAVDPAAPEVPGAPGATEVADGAAAVRRGRVAGLLQTRVGRGAGVVLVQALNSVTTVAQMALFAVALPRADFDDYSVWITANMFLVGLGQAVGTDRVVIGKRTREDGGRSARVLGLLVMLVQVGISAWLGSLPLVLCSIASLMYVTYDFQRFVRCFTEALTFLKRDLCVLLLQVVVIVAAWRIGGDSGWLVLGWWAVGAPIWLFFSGRDSGGLRAGLAVLRDDARECIPLLADAALAGVPMVGALALAKAQGDTGAASAARMAFTLLGPITVLGISARRMVYQRVASGPLSARFGAFWTAICGATFVLVVAVLSLTRTPLYPAVFHGFQGLAWMAILGYAFNHAITFATLLPSATLRAERRSFAVGVARVVATLAGVGAAFALMPFTSPTQVAWAVGLSSFAYAVVMYGAHFSHRRRVPLAQAVADAETVG